MLKQILKDMFVDPELLVELPEEQKQILFFKIREEQIRRYNQREKEYEKKRNKKENKAVKIPSKLRILEDSNGQPWTWVMGEHPNDIPIEEIWENLGNEIRVPNTRRTGAETGAPVSKVQAIIFARDKMKKDEKTSENVKEDDRDGNLTDSRIEVETKPYIESEQTSQADKKHGPETVSTEDSLSSQKTKQTPPPPVKPKPRMDTTAVSNLGAHHVKEKPEIPSRAPVHASSNSKVKLGDRVPPPPSTVDITAPKQDLDEENVYEAMDEISEALPVKELEENEWRKQLRQFKAADERRKFHARRASMEVKRLSRQKLHRGQKLATLRENFQRKRSQREVLKPSLPPKPTHLRPKHPAVRPGRLNRPRSRAEVEEWFREVQLTEILAYADVNNRLPDWFHGIISRFQSEAMLEDRAVGDYMIRVSEKIWGYALSYKCESKIKHFLIDASEANCYHFFGNDQIRHPCLEHLIAFHQDEAITYGGEILKRPVGQKDPNEPDYSDLIVPVKSYVNKVTSDTAL